MIPKELQSKIRHIEIVSRHLVEEVFSGQYHSVFKGRGVEFAEVREYQAGDDVRTIDWNVTARMGRLFVRKYVEERELTVVLAVDASASNVFGSAERFKGEVAVEICSLLAFSAIANNDRVGLMIFTDEIEKYIPPRKGRNHVLRLIRELLYFKPRRRGTDIAEALSFLRSSLSKKAVLFVVSDFIAEAFERPLKIVSGKHDVIAVLVSDPREFALPRSGLFLVEDSESGEAIVVDSSSVEVTGGFAGLALRNYEAKKKLIRSSGAELLEIATDQPYVPRLMRFFEERARRLR